MDALTAWVMILGLGATSLATRGSFVLFLTRFEVPRPVQRALRFVPPAVFTALLVPELVFAGGKLAIGPGNLKLLAALVAAPVAWRTKSTTVTILVGMAALLLAERYLG
jgi:branched-subunit amino acid transport protein